MKYPNKLYLCGPMSSLPDHNVPAFRDAAFKLRKRGFQVVNPAELDGGNLNGTWEYYLKRDIPELCKCEGVALLPGWEDSRGVNLELTVALALGMPIFDAHTLERLGLQTVSTVTDDSLLIQRILAEGQAAREADADLDDLHEDEEAEGPDDDGECDCDGPCVLADDDEPVTSEAERLVDGDRGDAYGHPLDDYTRTAKIWSAIIGHEVTAEQAILCMVGVKISREAHKPKRDNLVDLCGYALCLQRVVERRAELASEALAKLDKAWPAASRGQAKAEMGLFLDGLRPTRNGKPVP